MTLSAGTRLGPDEILSPLGAGAMGEAYRAKGWSADGHSVFICPIDDVPRRIERMDVASGKRRESWKSYGPGELAGIQRFERVAMAPGGPSFVDSTERVFCTLFVIDGLR